MCDHRLDRERQVHTVRDIRLDLTALAQLKEWDLAFWRSMDILVSGWCTDFLSGTKNVSVNRSPISARVLIDGIDYGLTPLTVDLDNKTSHTLVVSKYGFETISYLAS